jgi:hypothetical protein
VTPAEVIVECRRLLNDTVVPYRYSDTVMLGYVNQTIKRMAILRPDLFGELGEIPTTADTTIQSLPAGAHRLIDIYQVKDGDAVTEVDRETMARNHPSWMTEAAAAPVNFMRHVRNPTKFFLYPRPPADTILIGEYAVTPADYSADDEIAVLPPSYFGTVIDGVMFLASSIDDEHVNSGRSGVFLESFTQQLGVALQNRPVVDSKASGMQPSRSAADLGEVM